jgi:hypothetical protein
MPRKVDALRILTAQGIIIHDAEIEVVPKALPAESDPRDPLYHARIEKPEGRHDSIRWAYNNQSYSPTELAKRLWTEHGLRRMKTSRFWRRAGANESLWDEAERYR